MQNPAFEEIEIEQSSSAPEIQTSAPETQTPAPEPEPEPKATENDDKIVAVPEEEEIVSLDEQRNTVDKYSEVAADSEPEKAAISVVDVEYRYPRNYLLSDVNTLISDPLLRKQNPPVLEKISISAPRSKIYALLGSSGCGKSGILFLLKLQKSTYTLKSFPFFKT